MLDNVPYGTSFTLVEDFNEYYGQTAEAFRAGVRTATSTYGQTGRNNLVVRGYVHQRLYRDNDLPNNRVAVTNDRDATVPMGVIMQNAPFIGLMALAVVSGALGVMKLRKREYEEDMA